MSRKQGVLLVVALFVASAFWIAARLSGVSLAQTTQAVSKSGEVRKWEYCTIAGVNWDLQRRTSSATIGFMTPTGRRFETLDGGSSGDPLSVAFAKLGSEGWECVGQVMYNQTIPEYKPDTWLFRRPAF